MFWTKGRAQLTPEFMTYPSAKWGCGRWTQTILRKPLCTSYDYGVNAMVPGPTLKGGPSRLTLISRSAREGGSLERGGESRGYHRWP